MRLRPNFTTSLTSLHYFLSEAASAFCPAEKATNRRLLALAGPSCCPKSSGRRPRQRRVLPACSSAAAQPGLQAARRRRATLPARWRDDGGAARLSRREPRLDVSEAQAPASAASRAPPREARGTNKGAGRLVVLYNDAHELGARRAVARRAFSSFEVTAYAAERPVPQNPAPNSPNSIVQVKAKK